MRKRKKVVWITESTKILRERDIHKEFKEVLVYKRERKKTKIIIEKGRIIEIQIHKI